MKIEAKDLARLCYNAIQFSSKDSSLSGVVMFHLRPTENPKAAQALDVYASDDYVAMRDVAAAYPQDAEEVTFFLGLKELKALEKEVRELEGMIDVIVHEGEVEFDPVALSSLSLQIVSDPPDLSTVLNDFSAVVNAVHSEPNPFPLPGVPFAIRPERFAKFRLLKTPESPSCKDGYPVDFHWDGDILRWKCGPFLKGVVGPLTRESFEDAAGAVTGIEEIYREESECLW